MSDERQAFEQLHAIPSGAIWCENRDVYIHKNYSGMVLHPINESWEAFCEGVMWQAARAGQAASVPEEPTDEMLEASMSDRDRQYSTNAKRYLRYVYQAMVKAAQQPPKQEGE